MHRAAFTLIELVLVMCILALMAAFIAPQLAKGSRQRSLEQEALRLVATIEYAREEAVSQGAEMAVFLDAQTQRFGMEPASTNSGLDVHKDFQLNSDLHFGSVQGVSSSTSNRIITFTPEGVAAPGNMESVEIADRNGGTVRVVLDDNAWGYEVTDSKTP